MIIRFGHDWDQVCMQMDEVRQSPGNCCSMRSTSQMLLHPSVFHGQSAVCCADPGLQRGPTEELCRCGTPSMLPQPVAELQCLTGSWHDAWQRSLTGVFPWRAVIYLVDISECPDFNTMYELYDPCTCMFFFRNKVAGPPPHLPQPDS